MTPGKVVPMRRSLRQRLKSLQSDLDEAAKREKHLYEENERLARTAVANQDRVRQLEEALDAIISHCQVVAEEAVLSKAREARRGVPT